MSEGVHACAGLRVHVCACARVCLRVPASVYLNVTVRASVCPRMLVHLHVHVCIRVPARVCSIPKGKSTKVPVRTLPLTQY